VSYVNSLGIRRSPSINGGRLPPAKLQEGGENMARLPIQAEGRTKKHAARELNRKLFEAKNFGLFKDGKTMFVAKDGRIVAMVCVHS